MVAQGQGLQHCQHRLDRQGLCNPRVSWPAAQLQAELTIRDDADMEAERSITYTQVGARSGSTHMQGNRHLCYDNDHTYQHDVFGTTSGCNKPWTQPWIIYQVHPAISTPLLSVCMLTIKTCLLGYARIKPPGPVRCSHILPFKVRVTKAGGFCVGLECRVHATGQLNVTKDVSGLIKSFCSLCGKDG
jgi:hypothetical protein